MKKICYVAGAGEYYDRKLSFPVTENDYVIAVDGGYDWLEKSGIKADMVIGDFDSLKKVPCHSNVIRLNPEKDDTDMLAALKEGLKLGCDEFHIYGGTGGRIEHTFANLACLAYLAGLSVRGFLYDNHSIITAVTNATITFGKEHSGYVSVFSHTNQSAGVFLKGLKYELTDATLTNTFPLGVSNEFLGVESSVSVKEGTLIIVYENRII